MLILTGSTALKSWFPDFPREPKDIDYVFEDNTKGFDLKKHEGKVEYLWNPILFKHNKIGNRVNNVCFPDNLYTMKMSHLFWDINWEKHEWDATWLREKGCRMNYPLFWELFAFFNKMHGENKRSDLKMSSADFFDNALKCEYDHDWLHTLLNPSPTFNKVLKDGEEVEVSEDKFQLLTEQEKEALVREEVYVMAFERWPNINFRMAYGRMLKKFIVSHAPIWEAIWILENYKKLCRAEYNFIKHLNEKINERGHNIIKRPTRSIQKQTKVLSE